MNKLTIIGNVTKEPELRTTTTGRNVCSFSVAVNRRKKVDGQPDTDYFRVSAWDALGENCAKYLTKGKKVAVIGAVSVHAYSTNKGEAGASLEVMAQEVEFLTPREQEPKRDSESGMAVVAPNDLPF